jgi:acyl-coA reductase superfamily protein
LEANTEDIQCVVASDRVLLLDGVIPFGEAQCPLLDTYADNVDTMRFLEEV